MEAKELVSKNLTGGVSSRYLAFDWLDDSTSSDHGEVQGYQNLGAIVRRDKYTAFVVLRSLTTYHRFVPE
jgi:hypothetical protein